MKLAIAAIVAVSVLMMPTEGTAQSNPPETITEAWSCDGEITLTSSCTPSGACSGSFKLDNYPAKKTDFLLNGSHRVWIWKQDDKQQGKFPVLVFLIYPDGDAVFGSRELPAATPGSKSTILSKHRCYRP